MLNMRISCTIVLLFEEVPALFVETWTNKQKKQICIRLTRAAKKSIRTGHAEFHQRWNKYFNLQQLTSSG